MKVSYVTADGRLRFDFEASNDKEAFRQLAHLQELHEDEPAARVNGERKTGGLVKYRVRKAKYTDEKGKEKEAEYFEKMVVSGPLLWYKKSFGVLDDGSDNLFPKRQQEAENLVLGENGWYATKKKEVV